MAIIVEQNAVPLSREAAPASRVGVSDAMLRGGSRATRAGREGTQPEASAKPTPCTLAWRRRCEQRRCTWSAVGSRASLYRVLEERPCAPGAAPAVRNRKRASMPPRRAPIRPLCGPPPRAGHPPCSWIPTAGTARAARSRCRPAPWSATFRSDLRAWPGQGREPRPWGGAWPVGRPHRSSTPRVRRGSSGSHPAGPSQY